MKIKRKDLYGFLYIMVFVALIEPNGFTNTGFHRVLGLIRMSAFLVSLFYFVMYRLYNDKKVLLALSLIGWMTITTFLYSGTFSNNFLFSFRGMLTAIILSAFMIKKYPKQFVAILAVILSLWIFLDGVTWQDGGIFLTTNGQAAFFLGTKTSITYYLIPAFTFDFILIRITRGFAKGIGVSLLGITIFGAALYLVQQPISTAIVCFVMEVAALFVVNRLNRIINIVCKYGVVAVTVINILFLSGNVLGIFDQIITLVLHESGDMSGRFQIWAMVLAYIANRPLVGYGYSSGIRFDVWQSFNTSTHNMLLYLLFTMGLVGVAIFGAILYFIHKECNSKKCRNSMIAKYNMLSLVVIAFEAITESCAYNTQTMCLFMLMMSTNTYIMMENKIKNNYEGDIV